MAAPDVDTSTLTEMSVLIEQLTMSGKVSLDEKTCKQLKKICRVSDGYVRQAYRLIMAQLEKSHAEIRLSATRLINELFIRSHCFRELLLEKFQHFMELTLETDLEKPLPPPVRAAKELKKQSIKFVQEWFTKFGSSYRQLALGYNFLINCKKVNFVEIQSQTVAEERSAEERRAKHELRLRNRAQTALDEMNEVAAEIRSCIVEAESCMNLLVPNPNAFDIVDTDLRLTFSNNKDSADLETSSDRIVASENQNVESGVVQMESSDQKDETVCIENVTTDSNVLDQISYEHQQIQQLTQSEISEDKKQDDGCCSDHNLSDEDDENSEDYDKYGENIDEKDNNARVHGILNIKTNLKITINAKPVAIPETSDNVDIIVTLREQVTLARFKLLPSVKRWLDAFTRASGHEANLRSALDLKMDLENMLKKAGKLNITPATEPGDAMKQDDSDDDDDFVEVPEKEGYEPFIPAFLREEYGLGPLRTPSKPATKANRKVVQRKEIFSAEDPTSWAATLKKIKEQSLKEKSSAQGKVSNEPQPSTSKEEPSLRKNREELLKKAPVIPFGNDLYHWGDEIEAPLLVRNNTESLRWWKAEERDDKVDDLALAAIKQRTINFVGKFEPVKWQCRAPLKNGKLCIRMDRHKCPFHGKIIPRDNSGLPNGAERMEAKEKEDDIFEQKSNGWDDPELQADIFAATGIDLSLKKTRKGKSREKRFPDLTDLKSLKNTARNRLEEKLFSKATVKRVAQSLDDMDAKRQKEKFGNNFNYSCQS